MLLRRRGNPYRHCALSSRRGYAGNDTAGFQYAQNSAITAATAVMTIEITKVVVITCDSRDAVDAGGCILQLGG